MTNYLITFRRNGETDSRDIVIGRSWADDRDAVEALLEMLFPDEREPYGLVIAQNRGERTD
jgi:hypothetical protein